MKTKTGSRVLIIQKKEDQDYSELFHYGLLQYIFDHNGNLSVAPSALFKRAKEALQGFDPSDDFIVLNGDPVAIAVVSVVAMELFGYFRALKFMRPANKYQTVTIEK